MSKARQNLRKRHRRAAASRDTASADRLCERMDPTTRERHGIAPQGLRIEPALPDLTPDYRSQ